METWELDFEWLKVRHRVKRLFGKTELPDLNMLLFLIGIQELGVWETSKFSKEEKQELMHVAVCELLSIDGYYEFEGRDQDGWPHYKMTRHFEKGSVDEQEYLLKELIIKYFKKESVFQEEE